MDIQRAAMVVLFISSKLKFVKTRANSRPANIMKTAKAFIQTLFTIIANKSASKKQNITENYVAIMFSPF